MLHHRTARCGRQSRVVDIQSKLALFAETFQVESAHNGSRNRFGKHLTIHRRFVGDSTRQLARRKPHSRPVTSASPAKGLVASCAQLEKRPFAPHTGVAASHLLASPRSTKRKRHGKHKSSIANTISRHLRGVTRRGRIISPPSPPLLGPVSTNFHTLGWGALLPRGGFASQAVGARPTQQKVMVWSSWGPRARVNSAPTCCCKLRGVANSARSGAGTP